MIKLRRKLARDPTRHFLTTLLNFTDRQMSRIAKYR
jgi:hypothetical protein